MAFRKEWVIRSADYEGPRRKLSGLHSQVNPLQECQTRRPILTAHRRATGSERPEERGRNGAPAGIPVVEEGVIHGEGMRQTGELAGDLRKGGACRSEAAGQGDERCNGQTPPCGEAQGDERAHRVADKGDGSDAQPIGHCFDVGTEIVQAADGCAEGLAVPPKVRNHDVAPGKMRQEQTVALRAIGEAVQKEHRRFAARLFMHMQPAPARQSDPPRRGHFGKIGHRPSAALTASAPDAPSRVMTPSSQPSITSGRTVRILRPASRGSMPSLIR